MKETFVENDVRCLFGKNLKRLRGLQNISQMALSDKTGLTHNFINDIENGKKWVSADTIARISTALRVEPYQLFLPDSGLAPGADAFFSVYLNDFSDNVYRMVGDLRTRYFQDQDEESRPSRFKFTVSPGQGLRVSPSPVLRFPPGYP